VQSKECETVPLDKKDAIALMILAFAAALAELHQQALGQLSLPYQFG
jgi:hypothetical protein